MSGWKSNGKALFPDPAANTDARIIRVTVQLDQPSSARAAAFTGLEVTGRIATDNDLP